MDTIIQDKQVISFGMTIHTLSIGRFKLQDGLETGIRTPGNTTISILKVSVGA